MKMRYVAAAGLLAALAACAQKEPDSEGHKGYRELAISMAGSRLAFVKKGDHVDVLVTFDAYLEKGKEKVTATIIQNVLVAGVMKPAKLEDNGVIELVLNPNEAQYAALSVAQGMIDVIIRAEGDSKLAPMEMASFRKLFR